MTHPRTGDPELIRQKAIESLPPLFRFDLDLCRFHVWSPLIWLPEGEDTSAPAPGRTDSHDRSTRGTLRPSRIPNPGGVESAQAKTPK